MTTESISKHVFETLSSVLQRDEVKHEGVVNFWFLNPRLAGPPLSILFPKDIEVIRQLLSTKNMSKLKKGRPYIISKELIGDGVLATTGSVWHKQRVVVEKGFTNKLMRKQLHMVIRTAKDLSQRWKSLLKDQAVDGEQCLHHPQGQSKSWEEEEEEEEEEETGSSCNPSGSRHRQKNQSKQVPLWKDMRHQGERQENSSEEKDSEETEFPKSSDQRRAEQKPDCSVEVDMIEEMLKTTMDVLGRAAFSYDIGSLLCTETKDALLYDCFDKLLVALRRRVTNPVLYFTRNILPTSDNYHFKRSIRKLNTVVKQIIATRKEEQKNNCRATEKEPRDLLDILLQEKDALSEEVILDNMRTVLFAGHDTTAAALSWTFYLLCKHPQAVQKIRKETEQVFGRQSLIMATQRGEMEGSEEEAEELIRKLENCDYLNAVILEVLRLYPSAGFTRTATEDIHVSTAVKTKDVAGGLKKQGDGEASQKQNEKVYLIPKHHEIFIFPYLIHRDPKYWNHPNSFIPERWLSKPNEKKKLDLQARLAKATLVEAYLPFSLGKRNCVGRKLALLEIRVIVMHILSEFEFKIPKAGMPTDFQEIPYMGMTAFPKAMHISLSSRE